MPEEVSADQDAGDEQVKLTDQEVFELRKIAGTLLLISDAAERVLEATALLSHKREIQQRLQDFSLSLANLPLALRQLEDFRRHLEHLQKLAEQVKNDLTKLRGADDALSSEETRIIVSCASFTDHIMASISSLEYVLQHVRREAADLLAVIGYDGDDFEDFVLPMLSKIRIDLVSDYAHQEISRMLVMVRDLELLQGLYAHTKELQNGGS